MRKMLMYVSFSLWLTAAFAQGQGFFNVYEQAEKSFCASAAVETKDGGFIIALYDYYGGAGELRKISSDGVMLNRLPVSVDGVFSGIEGLYQDPSGSDSFYAIGHLTRFDEQVSKPFVMRFSEDLELLYWKEVNMPGYYHQFTMSRALLTSDGDFLYAASLGPQDAFHRLYMRIDLDGTLTRFHEETEGCGHSILVNAIFEFPEGNRFGEYRSSILELGFVAVRQRLFGFDDSFVFDTIHEYEAIQQIIGDTGYSVLINSAANATALPLNDSVLLFFDRAFEKWYDILTNATYATNNSAIMFSTDLDGNIKDYLVVGSRNDTVEVPFSFNAIDIVKTASEDRKLIYHGCFGYRNDIPDGSPYNITLTKTDEYLDVIWQKSYSHHTRFLQATSLLATTDGGCLVVGGAFDYTANHFDLFVLKTNQEGYLHTNEIKVEDIRPYAYWPNPARDELRLQYSPDAKPAQAELYDLQGRLVRQQRTGLETLSLEGLAPGTYTLRVTLEGGKTFSDKVVKE